MTDTTRASMSTIRDESELRRLLGEPSDLVRAKVADRLERAHATVRRPLARSCSSRRPRRTGSCDVSPRGDPPGFVHVLDDRTLLLPERPGNRLADSLRNVLRNPHVGLLFVDPGRRRHAAGERPRGDRDATRSCSRRAPSRARCRSSGILVEVEEVFTHCSKAFLRAQLWDPSRHVEPRGAAVVRRDPPEPRPVVRRRCVRRGARRALRAPRGLLLDARCRSPSSRATPCSRPSRRRTRTTAVRERVRRAPHAASGRCSRRST